jgi:hypothetical protein
MKLDPKAVISEFRRLAPGAAWLFIAVSAAQVLWVLALLLQNPGRSVNLYSSVVGGQTYSAAGLSYAGFLGLMWAFLQLLAIGGSATVSAWPTRSARSQRLRRISHAILVGWSTLWLLNFARLWIIDGQLDSFLQTVVMGGFAAATIHRARHGWNLPPSRDAAIDPVEPLTAAGVVSSRRVRELPMDSRAHHGNLSKSTLPPERITPTRSMPSSFLKSLERIAATGTAALGSMTSFIRSQTKRIAARISSSDTVKTRST